MAEKNTDDNPENQAQGSDENLSIVSTGRQFIRDLREHLDEELPFSRRRVAELRAPFMHTQEVGSILENKVWKVSQDDHRWGIFDPYADDEPRDTNTRRRWLTAMMSRLSKLRPQQNKVEDVEGENPVIKKEEKKEEEREIKEKKNGKETEQGKDKNAEEKEEGQKVSEIVEKEKKGNGKKEKKKLKKKDKTDDGDEEDGKKDSKPKGRMRRFFASLCCCLRKNGED